MLTLQKTLKKEMRCLEVGGHAAYQVRLSHLPGQEPTLVTVRNDAVSPVWSKRQNFEQETFRRGGMLCYDSDNALTWTLDPLLLDTCPQGVLINVLVALFWLLVWLRLAMPLLQRQLSPSWTNPT
jgi:hypothetical protein